MTAPSPTPSPPTPPKEPEKVLRIANHAVAIVLGIMGIIGGMYLFFSWMTSSKKPESASVVETPPYPQGDTARTGVKNALAEDKPKASELTPHLIPPPVESNNGGEAQDAQLIRRQAETVAANVRPHGPTAASPQLHRSSCPTSVITMRFDQLSLRDTRTAFQSGFSNGMRSVRISDCEPSGAFRTGGADSRFSRSGSFSENRIEVSFAYYHAGVIECSASGRATGPGTYRGTIQCDENINGTAASIPNVEITF